MLDVSSLHCISHLKIQKYVWMFFTCCFTHIGYTFKESWISTISPQFQGVKKMSCRQLQCGVMSIELMECRVPKVLKKFFFFFIHIFTKYQQQKVTISSLRSVFIYFFQTWNLFIKDALNWPVNLAKSHWLAFAYYRSRFDFSKYCKFKRTQTTWLMFINPAAYQTLVCFYCY